MDISAILCYKLFNRKANHVTKRRMEAKCSGDALSSWLDKTGAKQSEVAEALGVTYQWLWRIITSRQRPGWDVLLKIKKLTNDEVQPNDFALPLATESDTFEPLAKEELVKRVQRRRSDT